MQYYAVRYFDILGKEYTSWIDAYNKMQAVRVAKTTFFATKIVSIRQLTNA